MVWLYLGLVLVLSAIVWLGCCVAMDYSTYWDLQRRLQEERKKEIV